MKRFEQYQKHLQVLERANKEDIHLCRKEN